VPASLRCAGRLPRTSAKGETKLRRLAASWARMQKVAHRRDSWALALRLALLVPVLVVLGSRPSDALTVSNVVASTPVNTQIDVDLTKAINSEDPFPELGVGTPSHGTAVLGNGLDVIYTPAAGFIGTDSFTFTVFCSCTLSR